MGESGLREMRQPTRLQIFFAQNWPIRAWLTITPVIVVVLAVNACEPSLALCQSWQAVGFYLIVLIISPLLGYFGAVLAGVFIFGPMYYSRGLLNGAPFKEGDVVQILAGPHRGSVTTVYSCWQGDSVRVRLGPKEEEEFKDVFQPTQLLREEETEPEVRQVSPQVAPGTSPIEPST